MEKLIRMFNEFWEKNKVTGHTYWGLSTHEQERKKGLLKDYLTDHPVFLSDRIDPMFPPIGMGFHELFFCPYYKWFEAMRWKDPYKPKENRNDYNARYHIKECVGLTAEEIIQYCIENTVDIENYEDDSIVPMNKNGQLED